MEAWFAVKKESVIDILERKKDSFPWGEHPDEKYICLVFWDDDKIFMTVDEFFEVDAAEYECCRFYTTYVADNMEAYKSKTDSELSSLAYSAWCSGAR